MMIQLYLRPIGDETQFFNWASYADNPPFTAPAGFEWVEGNPPENATHYVQLNVLDRLEQLITLGQQAMSADPLPTDLQKQIFDLEVFIRNYYQRGATNLIQDSIQNFILASDRTDVTVDQRNQVEQLKSQMLEVVNGL